MVTAIVSNVELRIHYFCDQKNQDTTKKCYRKLESFSFRMCIQPADLVGFVG